MSRIRQTTELGKLIYRELLKDGPLEMRDLRRKHRAELLEQALISLRYASKAWIVGDQLMTAQDYKDHGHPRTLAKDQVLKLLADGKPRTLGEILLEVDALRWALRAQVPRMLKEGDIHIHGYKQDPSHWARQFLLGPSPGPEPERPGRSRAPVTRKPRPPLTGPKKPRRSRALLPVPQVFRAESLSIPEGSLTSQFVGGVNPWAAYF